MSGTSGVSGQAGHVSLPSSPSLEGSQPIAPSPDAGNGGKPVPSQPASANQLATLRHLRTLGHDLATPISDRPGASANTGHGQALANIQREAVRATTSFFHDVVRTEAQFGGFTLLQALLERSEFLPGNQGIENLVGSLLPGGALWNSASSGNKTKMIQALAKLLPNVSLSDPRRLSGAVAALITEVTSDPRRHAASLGTLLQNTAILSPDQVTSLLQGLYTLNQNGFRNVLENYAIDMGQFTPTQRSDFMARYGTEIDWRPLSQSALKSSALATLATHPDPEQRSELHQKLIGNDPKLQDLCKTATIKAAKASPQGARMLLDHLAAMPLSADVKGLLGNGEHLGKMLSEGVEAGHPDMHSMMFDYVTKSELPRSEKERTFNGGMLSDTASAKTPLTAAIRTDSLDQMKKWMEAVRPLGLPPSSIEHMLVQSVDNRMASNSSEYQVKPLQILSMRFDSSSGDTPSGHPTFAAYGTMLHDFGLDAAAKTRVLSASTDRRFPPFYSALKNGHLLGSWKTIGQVLASLDLPPAANLQTILVRTRPSDEHPHGQHMLDEHFNFHDDADVRNAPVSIKELVSLARLLPLPGEALPAFLNFAPDADGRWISTGLSGSHANNPLVWGQPSAPDPTDSEGVAEFKAALNDIYAAQEAHAGHRV